jgi:hypothetical protein
MPAMIGSVMVRPYVPSLANTEPSECMCQICGVPMDEGDHAECPVELLACPDHMDKQLGRMGYEPGTSNMPRRSEGAAAENFFKDSDGNPTIGFCLWCNQDFNHPVSGEFTILADPCILARKDLIAEITKALHLPKKTKFGSDPHYRCFLCLYGKDVDDE